MTDNRRMARIAALLGGMLACVAVPTARAWASGGGGAADVHFVEMAMLDVPIVESGRTTGRLRTQLTLRAADAGNADELATNLPMLREAALAAAGEFARLRASPNTPVDAQRLSHEMSAAVAAADHAVSGVLIVRVSATRL